MDKSPCLITFKIQLFVTSSKQNAKRLAIATKATLE